MSRPAGDPATWPAHIRTRYAVSDRPRWLPAVLVVLGVAFAVAATAAGWRLVTPDVSAGLAVYDIVADDRVSARFDVQRRVTTGATCVLRARAEDGFDVAYAVIELPSGQGRTSHDYQLRTAYRALVAELLGCGADGPPPGIPGAQFRPGVVPPEQPWTAGAR